MVKQKDKGNRWEREGAELLQKKVERSSWRRVPGSGAIGTIFNEPLLASDIRGIVDAMTKEFRVDAKVGYGGAKQLTVRREWLEKIREEAESADAIPLLLCKFSGARGKIREFVVMDVNAFAEILNIISEFDEEITNLLEKIS